MSASYWVSPAVFLIETLFSLYLFALMLRFLLQWFEGDFYNPISQFLVKLTHPPLRYLRRIIPSIGRVDLASLVLMLALQALDIYLVSVLQQFQVNPANLAVAAFAQLLELLYDILFYSILISALLSWFAPGGYNPAVALLYSLTEPMLRSVRRLLPPMGGLDLSPLVALIVLQFAKMVIFPPLQQLIAMLN
jgi:YggT family protein